MSCKHHHTPASVWKNPLHFTAFGFGSGAFPIAPGTAGTVVGVLFYMLAKDLSLINYLILITGLFIFGCYICGRTEKDLSSTDHPGIVWDEIVGYMLTMTAAPHGWLWILFGFIVFRAFDILKPWPIKMLEDYLKGGLAVMMDDVLAGLASLAVIQVCALFFR